MLLRQAVGKVERASTAGGHDAVLIIWAHFLSEDLSARCIWTLVYWARHRQGSFQRPTRPKQLNWRRWTTKDGPVPPSRGRAAGDRLLTHLSSSRAGTPRPQWTPVQPPSRRTDLPTSGTLIRRTAPVNDRMRSTYGEPPPDRSETKAARFVTTLPVASGSSDSEAC